MSNPVVAIESVDLPVISLIRDQTAKSFPVFQEKFPASSIIFAVPKSFLQNKILACAFGTGYVVRVVMVTSIECHNISDGIA
jgi:hypothetical protein